jgi:type I restriction enzyme R subunit
MCEEREWQTRKKRIDKKLISISPSWKIIPYQPNLDVSQLTNHAVEEFQTEHGPADYALFVNGKLLGIIEAKKVKVGPQNVLQQAKRYSRGVKEAGVGNWSGYGVPFLYSSNGEIIWHIDIRNEKNISRQISNFHTPAALEEFFQRTSEFFALPVLNERLRPYQIEALKKTEEAIAKGKRALLIAMATGSGKTFLVVSQAYRLLESKQFKRVLFLVDRRALAAQAVREFAAFTTPKGNKFNQEYEVYSQRFRKEDFGEDEPFDPKVLPNTYLTEPDATKTFVYISTIQRMTINLFGWENAFDQDRSDPDYEEDADKFDTEIPIHAFDLIVADECHRGYTAKESAIWRTVMDYFDAIKVGLTATPAPHSLSLFKEVVFRYTTDEAIGDGYLVDYEPVAIRSDVRIHGAFLKEGEHIGVIDTHTGEEIYDELEDEREFSAEEIERKITSPDSNRKIIQEIAKHAYRHEEDTGRFPRILIFAVNDIAHTSHADQLVRICREEFGQGDAFVEKITGSPSVDRPLQKIRQFRNRPNPKIAVTVDMLTTGVDIPKLEFVVFMRPVKSRILWVQMLGRGTRLCPEIHKTHFVIFDCFGGSLIDYFKNTTDFKVEVSDKEPLTVQHVIENIYQNVDRAYYTKVLVKRMRRIERHMSGEAREKFTKYIEAGDIKKFADQLPDRIANDFTETMKLLRNPDFQDLLINYPRAKRTFYVGYEIEDRVVSDRIYGHRYKKPEDYLDAFCKFVQENRDQISAIQVLTERPREWKTEVLNELRAKLARNKFPEDELQRAHELVYKKSLADIISMVKHAAREEEPILTAEERVDSAFKKIMAGKAFDEEQAKWLGFIKEHLVHNLTIGRDDFEYAPLFERNGGLGKAKKVFGGELESLMNEINHRIAA